MPSFRWTILNLRYFLLPKHRNRETAGPQLNSVPQHLAFRGSSLWKLYWQYTPLELPYPLPAGTFWVDDFPNFPRWDICFLLPSSSQPGANYHTSPTRKTLKKKAPIPSWCRPTPQISASQKSSLFSTSLAQSQRIIGGVFSLEDPTKKNQPSSAGKLLIPHFDKKKHPRRCCGGEIFGIWWPF